MSFRSEGDEVLFRAGVQHCQLSTSRGCVVNPYPLGLAPLNVGYLVNMLKQVILCDLFYPLVEGHVTIGTRALWITRNGLIDMATSLLILLSSAPQTRIIQVVCLTLSRYSKLCDLFLLGPPTCSSMCAIPRWSCWPSNNSRYELYQLKGMGVRTCISF